MKNRKAFLVPTVALMGVLALSACSKPEMAACTDPRPVECPETYEPVCAKTKSGKMVSRASVCAACSDFDVVGTFEGKCPGQEDSM